MSDSPNGVGEIRNWINLEARAPFDDNEEALEALVNIKELEFGDVFTDRDTQLDSEENEGISITFFHEDDMNILHLGPGDEDDIQIDLHLVEDVIDEAEYILNSVLNKVPSITLIRLSAGRSFEVPFHGLDLPIREDTETEIIGLRIRRNEADFMIQEMDGESTTIVLMSREQGETYDDSFPQELITNVFDEMQSIIEEGL